MQVAAAVAAGQSSNMPPIVLQCNMKEIAIVSDYSIDRKA